MKTIIYVETSVLSRLLDYQRSGKMRLKKVDIDALDALSERTDVQLVTSEKTLQEFRDTQEREHRIALTLLYRLIAKVSAAPLAVPRPRPVIVGSGGRRGGGVFIGGGAMTDPDLARLQQIFEPDDAEHIFHAARSGCTHFLTVDYTTILARAPTGKTTATGDLLIVSPAQLIADLAGRDEDA